MSATDKVKALQAAYYAYMSALKDVVELGDSGVNDLLDALNHKHANPIAKALGIILHIAPTKRRDIVLRLARSLVGAHPLYPDALEAIVRSGADAWPVIEDELNMYAKDGDDEGVRCMLDAAVRLPDSIHRDIVNGVRPLLFSASHDIREAACDAVGRIGAPSGSELRTDLATIAKSDGHEAVRTAAHAALSRVAPRLE